MALQEIITKPQQLRVLMALPQDRQKAALRAANPQMVSELEAVRTTPNRVRKLTVESVCELLSWIDDPEVVASICSVDPRSAVNQTATRRLRDLKTPVETPLVANSANIEKRTRKSLEKPIGEILPALLEMSEFTSELVAEWVTSLPDTEFITLLPQLVGERNMREVRGSTVRRTRALIEGKTPAEIALICAEVPTADFLEQILYTWHDTVWPIEAAAVTLAALQSRYIPYSMRSRPMGVTPDAAALWRSSGRTDLLIWVGEASDDEVRAAFAAMTLEGLVQTARLTTTSRQATFFVVELEKRGRLFNRVTDRAMDQSIVPMLSRTLEDDTIVKLLSIVGESVLLDWFFHRFENNQPTVSLLDEVVKKVVGPQETLAILRRLGNVTSADSPTQVRMVRLLAEVVDSSAAAFYAAVSGYSDNTAVSRALAELAGEVLGASEEAWSVFWALFTKTAQGSLMDILNAASALCES